MQNKDIKVSSEFSEILEGALVRLNTFVHLLSMIELDVDRNGFTELNSNLFDICVGNLKTVQSDLRTFEKNVCIVQ